MLPLEKKILETFQELMEWTNPYGVEYDKDLDQDAAYLICAHPADERRKTQIYLGPFTPKEMVDTLSLSSFFDFTDLHPEQLLRIFEQQQTGKLYVETDGDNSCLEFRWKAGRLEALDAQKVVGELAYRPNDLSDLRYFTNAYFEGV